MAKEQNIMIMAKSNLKVNILMEEDMREKDVIIKGMKYFQ